MNPLISIILPIYNGEKTLDRCLSSLINQDYPNIEIVCVNDGSKDGSASILQRYAEKDKRIKIFSKDNGGESSARNFGLDKSCGEWVTFCDQDDWVDIDYVSSFFLDNPLQENTLYITGEKEGFTPNSLRPQYNIYRGGVNNQEMKDLLQKNGTTWGKLFCRKVIDKLNLRYNTDVFYGDDKLFTLCYLSVVDMVKYNENVFPYNYVNDFRPSKFMKCFDKEMLNYTTIDSVLRKTFPSEFKPEWMIQNFKLLFYSVFCEKIGFKDKINNLKTIHQKCKDVIHCLAEEKGLISVIFRTLNRGKFYTVMLLCNISIPLVVKLFSMNVSVGLKSFLKRIG
ncbi:MAG: glycosyltransferase family 2 protein [Bacteroidales bacterium]|nr:glycosyltransferase family 2 protein [Bacteroidales bacterium]